jgi:two-component system nitrate/nitrite response regulator NarL
MNRAITDTVLVGQNALLREGLARILSSAGFRIIGSASSIDELILNSPSQQLAFLLIIDVGEDFDTAFAQLKSFKKQYPAGRVAMLAHKRQQRPMMSAFRLGANAYLSKAASSDAFIATLELVMLGVTSLPPEILTLICHERDRSRAASHCGDAAHRKDAPDDEDGDVGKMTETTGETNELVPHDTASLTPLSIPQQSILRCLIQGDSNKSIARKLAISEATAKAHVKSILRKIRVHNRTQAAIWAISAVPLIAAKDALSPEQVKEAAAVPAGKRASFDRLTN